MGLPQVSREAEIIMNYLKADGFDAAIIGIDMASERLVYDKRKMVEILTEEMSEEDAIEYLEFNTWGAYVGEQTPIYVDRLEDVE
jgi:hypothetical protein